MRRILLFTYHFPPIGGAGAQRPVKFARYLPDVGYEPVVLTGPGDATGRWTPSDPSLAGDVRPETRVLRVAGPEPQARGRWGRRAQRWLRLSSPWQRWWAEGAVATGVSGGRVDAIWTIMPPYESAEPSIELARRLSVPWVADLGDPWALDEMMVYPTGAHRRLEERRMGRVLGSAAAVVMSTREAVLRVRSRFPGLTDKLVVAIPNGFDAADFGVAPAPRADGKFRIVHTGYLHTELGSQQRRTALARRVLGGQVRGVDIYARSHVYLLRAIDRLIAEDRSLESKIEVLLAGVLSERDREVADSSPVVRTVGYVSHAESVALLRSADLLFLPMQDLLPGQRAGIVPGKTYEYLASGRPILAAVPEGDARDILKSAGATFLCLPDDVDGMCRVIRDRLGERPETAGWRDRAVVDRFEYQGLTREVGTLLETVLSNTGDN